MTTTAPLAPLTSRSQFAIDGADVLVESAGDRAEIVAELEALTAGGPFALAAVEPAGAGRHRCSFRVRAEHLAVGYRNIIDLQHRIAACFDIVSVHRSRAHAGC
jgi:hypothetical protein